MRLDTPRPLSTTERSVLDALLAESFPGVQELRMQVEHATVVARCDCGCPTVDLTVPPEIPPSPVRTPNRLAPVEGRVRPLAEEPVADIILFVDDGQLRRLELVSYDDPAPSEWPSLDRVTVERTARP